MFVWKVSRFLDELSRTMPEFYLQLMTIDAASARPNTIASCAKCGRTLRPADGRLRCEYDRRKPRDVAGNPG